MTPDAAPPADARDTDGGSDLTIVIVSFNTRELTLRCVESVFSATSRRFSLVVFDNASTDGSPEALAARFPLARLIRSPENVGFARANNIVAAEVETEWLLLLNPDTEVRDGAVDHLLAFAESRPECGIYGGRTIFPDGSLNIASCWNKITPWSAFCRAVGLTALFKRTAVFDPEAIGGWTRDSVREVDIVVGCFLLIRTALWRELGGFDERFWMYGEEADLCLRARARGWRPAVTPDATIMHLVGAASANRADKLVLVAKARTSLMLRHWPRIARPWARVTNWLWLVLRVAAAEGLAWTTGGAERRERWRVVWGARADWMAGYPIDEGGS